MRFFISTLYIFLSINSISQTQTIDSTKLKIWYPNKKYRYNVIYSDSEGKSITTETIVIKPTGKKWEFEPKQTLLIYQFNFSHLDSVRLAPNAMNGISKPWEREIMEGAIENSAEVWMHPIRVHQYLLNEIAPFPNIKFPAFTGKTWKVTLWVYEAFGSFQGTIENTYTITGKEIREFSFGRFPSWKIEANGIHDKLGENKVTFYFSEELGFTEMHYEFFNKQKIDVKLVSLP